MIPWLMPLGSYDSFHIHLSIFQSVASRVVRMIPHPPSQTMMSSYRSTLEQFYFPPTEFRTMPIITIPEFWEDAMLAKYWEHGIMKGCMRMKI